MSSKSYRDLQKEIASLQAKAEALRAKELAGVIADIRSKMEAYGISVEDLTTSARRRAKGKRAIDVKQDRPSRGPVAAKYRDADSGQTWSGRGRVPRWLVAFEQAGRMREEFRV